MTAAPVIPIALAPPPMIWLGTDMARMVDESIAALALDRDVFVRGGRLVRIIPSDGTDSDVLQRAPGAAVIRLAARPWVRERLSLHAEYLTKRTTKEEGEKTVAVQVPGWIAEHVIERGTWPGYRALVGVVASPTIRRDGTVLQTPGYDARSGIVFAPPDGVSYPAVPDEPTQRDAEDARDELLGVIDDFPLDAQGTAGWLALVLSLVAREMVDGPTPLFLVDAPTAGSGKGLLVNVAHRIAYGHDAAHMSVPEDGAEWRKSITTVLLSGDPACLLDNIKHPLGDPSLDAVITAPHWKVRLLGKNEDSGSLVPRVVWLATGNGVELVGDLGRRTLRIRLEPNVERPEERTDYRHADRAGADALLAWTLEHRAHLVTQALTILRAYQVHGRPSVGCKPWGSFDSWVATIASAVKFAGLPDPSLARATTDVALDPERAALAIVYAAIARLDAQRTEGHKGVTAREIVQAGQADQDGRVHPDFVELAGALEELCPRGGARTLGRKLKAGRIIDGLRLTAHNGAGAITRYRALSARNVVEGSGSSG